MKLLKFSLLFLLLLAAIGMLALQSDWGKGLAKKFLSDALEESGYRVEIGQFAGTIPHAIDLKNVKIESDSLSIAIDSLDTRLSLLALLKKELLFTNVKASGLSWQLKPGATPALGKGKGLSFEIRIKRFHLDEVKIPEAADTEFTGSVRVGKKNRDFYFDVEAKKPELAGASLRLIAYLDEGGLIRLKGSLKTPTLQALPVPFPFEAAADLQFGLRGRGERLYGHLSGTVTPQSFPLDPLRPWIETPWALDARLAFDGKVWDIPRFAASAQLVQANGSARFGKSGQFETAHVALQGDSPPFSANLEITAADGIAVRGNGSLSKLQAGSFSLEKIETHADLLWREGELAGSALAAAKIEGKGWKGKSDLSWKPGGSLFLSSSELQGPAAQGFGQLEIRPDRLLAGQTEFVLESLQELPLDLFGKLEGKIDWLVSNGKQVATLDAAANNLYWKDLFADRIAIDASLIDPFAEAQGRVLFEAESVRWREMALTSLRFETLLGSSDWPFALSASGQWRQPLQVQADGFWRYKNGDLTCTLETASGSFYSHPFALSQPVSAEYFPGLFRLGGLDLSVSDARLFLKAEEIKGDLNAQLLLERFPLDVFSLNPLDVSIGGRTNCAITLSEKGGKTTGSIQATVDQLEVASPGESPTLKASGKFEGSFNNERLQIQGNLNTRTAPLLSLDLSLPIQLEIHPPSASLDLDSKATGRLALKGKIEEILDFFDLGTHRVQGDIDASFTLSNTLRNPDVDGALYFTNGYYENYLTGTRLLSIQAEGKARGSRFTLDSFSANDGKGSLIATGEIDLRPAEEFPFLFDLSFKRFNLAQIDLVTAEADGTLQIVGNAKEALAKGSVQVIESRLHIPDRIPRSLPNLVVVYKNADKPLPLPPTPPSNPYPLRLDLEVKAPDGVFIDGRGVNSEWKGNFHIQGTYTSVAAEGKLELIKGEFAFAGRRFKLLDGAISFTGAEHEMPYLNLAAEMQVKDISIVARLKGPLNNPQLTLQSTPPLPLSTIMSYLLFGQEIGEINSFQALQLANSLSAVAGQGPDVLEKTRKALGVDRLNIVSVSSGDSEIEDAIALQVGKYVSEGVLVSLTQGAEEASTNISIEIEVKNGWVVQLESDQRQEQGKFTVKWNHNY